MNKIEETQKTGYAVLPFDLAVMDEAHRIAGRADEKWAIVNDAKRIHADRRLYMTATPGSSPLPSWRTSGWSETRRCCCRRGCCARRGSRPYRVFCALGRKGPGGLAPPSRRGSGPARGAAARAA
ncbi:DEAD/DEAH box helicase family protein [Streptomyces sp. NPDC053069]|uniref:DEAD/DEAH box helicase family protein n=1 Tax=Streptomyces sp. NPDC053069 TaxID=3365695 RepID=UPI0037D130C0